MAAQLASRPNVIDVLDRVLDKAIVIDAWMRVGLIGLDLHLVEIESRMVVASIDTYLKYARL
jgi:Gas vesicle protein